MNELFVNFCTGMLCGAVGSIVTFVAERLIKKEEPKGDPWSFIIAMMLLMGALWVVLWRS